MTISVSILEIWQHLDLTMAATTLEEAPDFDTWLSFKLKSLDTDDDVFGSYIKGILEGEESQDEKIEAIEGILGEIASVKCY